ncbi:MAG: BlaI/MecI/CopY family transcriptional regulator, partial [Clostridia bacterium]|nr:BlaI/MecI/CopY family transcriptional regulator [Clostridia bacterium]
MEEQTLREKIAEMLDKADAVDYTVQLPDTEFDVMCAVWAGELPITTGYLMQVLGTERNWKTPTLISFL